MINYHFTQAFRYHCTVVFAVPWKWGTKPQEAPSFCLLFLFHVGGLALPTTSYRKFSGVSLQQISEELNFWKTKKDVDNPKSVSSVYRIDNKEPKSFVNNERINWLRKISFVPLFYCYQKIRYRSVSLLANFSFARVVGVTTKIRLYIRTGTRRFIRSKITSKKFEEEN